ncbi:hypothetical protein FN846DRAFT_647161 [Sphaerosporella brunnea]|uniref:Thiaminase-2/PQQC domain-containing protein n=1 Tax=Sphaerosporella brunnea TaxID=1250544 RepID=A0A5J5F0N4_9PEZI|nr:hypothetical protein FN846DRAFT_647161 [Sphaerosporella brunnea]
MTTTTSTTSTATPPTSWNLTRKLAQASTETPFIQHLSAGTLPAKSFDDWLYNDYVYVRSHIRFIARLISVLPAEAAEVEARLRDGYRVLGDELAEFRRRAGERGIHLPSLPAVPQTPEEEDSRALDAAYEELAGIPGVKDGCKVHMKFMLTLAQPAAAAAAEWKTLLAVFWASEKVYCDAMWFVKEAEGFARLEASMSGFVGWWANVPFREYVDFLEEAVAKTGVKLEEVQGPLEELLRGEEAFWRMCEEGLE